MLVTADEIAMQVLTDKFAVLNATEQKQLLKLLSKLVEAEDTGLE
ncbi:hypothetical protein UNDKW_3909 [Undibacterium sp. KW1]|nr:hypothetical protein [Undibacterium sp. KW1]BBB62182.1 hypothetical protein UNDKW_3909 [Undibacterium sp. KW1]